LKLKTVYICEKCTYQSSGWSGKCPECNAWDSFVEDVIDSKKEEQARVHRPVKPSTIANLKSTDSESASIGLSEVDRVLGGGLTKGSLVLLGGEPGIGKSTLTLQICNELLKKDKNLLYVSGEESVNQISTRGKRLKALEKMQILYATNFETILATLEEEKPEIAVIDSIQVISSSNVTGLNGGVGQVRYCTEELMSYAKKTGTTLIVIGHVNKAGNIAGPKTLEHLVDTVLYLEGDRYQDLRLLRGVKNRFGSTNEVGIFKMSENGLEEVTNPSEDLIGSRVKGSIGSCLTATMEGTRPLIVEVQALVNKTHFGYPKRTASGFDLNRLNLLIAVLEKYAKLDLSEHDVYINIVGGMKLTEPAVDLAVCLAVVSSYKKKPLGDKLVAFGEVGLSGEIRKATKEKDRIKEIKNLKLDPMQPVKDIDSAIQKTVS